MKFQQKWIGAIVALFTILVVAGCSSANESTAPAAPITLTANDASSKAEIMISPGIVGPNEYKIVVKDANNQPLPVEKATLHFAMPKMNHGKSEEVLVKQPDGTLHGEGPHIMMSGTWELKLEWTDAAGKTTSKAFELSIK